MNLKDMDNRALLHVYTTVTTMVGRFRSADSETMGEIQEIFNEILNRMNK